MPLIRRITHFSPYVVHVAIAAFCTTYARLELYKALDKLGDQVCYMDTDSCVYVSYPGGQEI